MTVYDKIISYTIMRYYLVALKVCIYIIVTASADETAVSVAVMMMISEITQICRQQLAESTVKLIKYD